MLIYQRVGNHKIYWGILREYECVYIYIIIISLEILGTMNG